MGGTVGPDGKIVWEMHVPLDEQLGFYRSHPPRALASLVCTPVDVDWRFDGHGEPVNSVFGLACGCGGKQFWVLAPLNEGDVPYSPVVLECDGCDSQYIVFDGSKHGWDGELGSHSANDDHVPVDLAEPSEVIVRFEYPSDVLGDDEWKGREQDLFSWITLLVRNDKGQLGMVFEQECA
jgi:hypothetical protein